MKSVKVTGHFCPLISPHVVFFMLFYCWPLRMRVTPLVCYECRCFNLHSGKKKTFCHKITYIQIELILGDLSYKNTYNIYYKYKWIRINSLKSLSRDLFVQLLLELTQRVASMFHPVTDRLHCISVDVPCSRASVDRKEGPAMHTHTHTHTHVTVNPGQRQQL